MQLELEIPERLLRKFKALNALEGGINSLNIEDLVIKMMEEAVTSRIFQLIEGLDTETSHRPYKPSAQPQFFAASSDDDVSGIADGLGDDEMPVPPETDEEALVPADGGITDEELEHDLEVKDPKHEAAVEAPTLPNNIKSGDAFTQMVGLPLPPDDDNLDLHPSRRRQRPKLKAKVRPMNEDYEQSSF